MRNHAAAVQIQDMSRDGKTETHAAVLAGKQPVFLPEALEDERKHLACDALAVVDEATALSGDSASRIATRRARTCGSTAAIADSSSVDGNVRSRSM